MLSRFEIIHQKDNPQSSEFKNISKVEVKNSSTRPDKK